MQIKYRFSINGTTINPIWKDDLQKEYELESQQRFYRTRLSGKIYLIRDDFDLVNSQPFETEFIFLVEKSNDGGQTWGNYWTGKFFKTDCKWDSDNKKVEVKLEVKDSYNDVLAGLEKEYNLIKLTPGKTELIVDKRPLIQTYIPGDSVVGCFLSGNAWEQDTAFEVTDENALVNTYYFALASTLHKIYVSGDGTPADCVGDYVGESSNTWYSKNVYGLTNNVYKIIFEQQTTYNVYVNHDKTSNDIGSIWRDSNSNDWVLTEIVTGGQLRMTSYFHSNAIPAATDSLTHVKNGTNIGTITYTGDTIEGNKYLYSLKDLSDNIQFYSKNSYNTLTDGLITFLPDQGTGTFEGYKSTIKVYMRYLLDVDEISGLNTYPIPTDDIVEYNRNYKRAIGYAIDQVSITANANVEPTEYGLRDDGYYFDEPPGFPSYYKYYPIAKSTWGLSSIWFNFDLFDWILEEKGRKSYTMKDTSMISEVIRVLLLQFAPWIDHDGTSEYSEFLYGTTNPITFNSFRLMLTQKSNVTAGEYDRPAQKAPITLGAVLSMLRDTFQCYWYIEDNKFKIEHISWFKNGGTYSPTPLYSADLTTLIQRKNNKTWGFESSKWEFDKADMSERLQFKWMDDVTVGFEGVPIIINSKFVQEGKVDDINVGDFTTDIDYMLLNPLAINQDGFALFATFLDTTNLFDINASDIELDHYINPNNGTSVPSTIFNATGYVPLTPGKWYTRTYGGGMAFYDANKTYISGLQHADNVRTFQAPAGAEYMRSTVSYAFWPGFRVQEGQDLNGVYKLPYIQRTIDGADLRLQNGYASWIYLQPNFWNWDLPAFDVTINNDPYTFVEGIQRKKKQNVKYPSVEDPDPIKLIKTYIGDGEIEKISINLSSRMNEIQLKYDTE